MLIEHEHVSADEDQQVLKHEAVELVGGVSLDSVESVQPAVDAAIELLLLEAFVELSEALHHESAGFLQLLKHLVGDLQVSDGALTLAEVWHCDMRSGLVSLCLQGGKGHCPYERFPNLRCCLSARRDPEQ